LEAWGFEGGGAWGELEAEAVKGVFPDYASADFAAYLRIVDSTNPMHRLWSDSPWLKYGLAHGCYWRKCAFCDTELEYVADFARCDVEALMEAAGAAAARTGLSGIHFVDEAMPMASLLEFARLNRIRAAKEGDSRAFSFWGNVRFDASWTQDRCELLAASGLVAVSGGIEIATSRGLEMTDKGFDLKSLVRTLVAMRRAGLLVHAYLIYGFPGQDATDIVDSAEFCRQLFASGLVDSAFWHRFVLTRHSRMYAEWKAGGRPGLVPEDRPWSFANNDLGFEGEADFDVWDEPLASSLAAWMEGRGLDRPIGAWFRRGAPRPTIGKDLAEALIGEAEEALDGEGPKEEGTAVWVGGAPAAVRLGRGRSSLRWAYRGEMKNLELADRLAEKAAAILGDQGSRLDGRKFSELRTELGLGKPQLDELVSSGLLVV
ncbi:MAG TPA: radical SAM protein, partial [Rectinemataceae bacterium]